MKNVCVTGGAGFIGSNFVRYLLEHARDVRVVTLDALTYAGNRDNLKTIPHSDHHTFLKGDICDREMVSDVLKSHTIDTIVHFAAETHVDRSIHGSSDFIRTNVVGTHTLLEEARNYWLEGYGKVISTVRFHHVSTDEVYGSLGSGDTPNAESSPYAPNSPYAASKAAADHLVRAFGRTYGLPYTITNCTNNYGPYQYPEKLIPLVILNALKGNTIPVYGDGGQIRDWLYVDDHCEAIFDVLTRGVHGATYNVGGGNQFCNIEIIRMICGILDRLAPRSPFVPHERLIAFVDDRPGHDRRYDLDTTVIKTSLGWRPAHSLAAGLEKTVAWYMDNREWISSICERSDYREWIDLHYSGRK